MIPRATIERAENILISQPYVPRSPAIKDLCGDIYVCGAAALALAGIERQRGTLAANEFRAKVCSVSAADLENTYRELGWQPDACRAMRECNDTAPPIDRLNAVIRKLEALPTLQSPTQ